MLTQSWNNVFFLLISVGESTDKDQKRFRRAVSSARQVELSLLKICACVCVCVLLILSTPGEGWGDVGPL